MLHKLGGCLDTGKSGGNCVVGGPVGSPGSAVLLHVIQYWGVLDGSVVWYCRICHRVLHGVYASAGGHRPEIWRPGAVLVVGSKQWKWFVTWRGHFLGSFQKWQRRERRT